MICGLQIIGKRVQNESAISSQSGLRKTDETTEVIKLVNKILWSYSNVELEIKLHNAFDFSKGCIQRI